MVRRIGPLLLLIALVSPAHGATKDALDQSNLAGLQWRNVGPFRGGRVTAVAGVPGRRGAFYFGGTGSGIWKSTNNGATWANVSDGELGTGSVGAVTVAPSDPNVIYAGMGEGCIRGNASHGDGVYKSVDAGATWTRIGLTDTRQVGRIEVHPTNPDVAWVAALGHPYGPNAERGLFRTRDGGASWKRVLAVNDSTGAIDVSLDPANPRVVYATTWQVLRTPWSLESGGPGSGLWKSTDGGDTWTRLKEGLPKGIWGKAGVSAAPGGRVYAMVEADDGGVYRSDDQGRTWTRTNEDRNLRQRAWYYTHVHADPDNPDVVWVQNVQLWRSGDGGKTFTAVDVPHGDCHDLWIDPTDTQRILMGDDGGATVTLDGGASWTAQENQPTAQFYRVVTDDGFPYRLYGSQQDNTSVAIASRTAGFGIGPSDWYAVGGGESGWLAPKPGDPAVVYGGSYGGYLTRYDHRTGQERNVNPWPDNPMGWGAEGARYRFQWTFPIVVSPHDPNTVYAASHVLHRSTDEGHSWTTISGDLTRNHPPKLGPSGGPITKDNTSVEYYCTIFALAESRKQKGLLWVGSDDGLVHVSRNAGATWTNVTPKGLPPWATIAAVEPSPHDPAVCYVAAHRYRLDDFRPYAFVTRDYGRSWRAIAGDLPADAFVRVVREDVAKPGLLFAGTELGAWWSNDGARWRPLRLNRPGLIADLAKPDGEVRGALPVVPITDLVVHENDLVAATQGRSFWILDDLTPLRQWTSEVAAAKSWLFTPTPATIYGGPPGSGNVGSNPPYGAFFYYRLAAAPKDKEEITLEILDLQGRPLRRFTSRDSTPADGGPAPPKLPAEAGLNRFAWDFNEENASRFKGLVLWGGGLAGPTVVPGAYQARLTVGGAAQTRTFEVRWDPRLKTSLADYRARYELHRKIRDKLTETHDAIVRLRDVKEQLDLASGRAKAVSAGDTTIAAAARALSKKLTEVEEALYQTKNKSNQDPLNYPIRLNNKLSILTSVINSADAQPTAQTVAVHGEVVAKIDAELAKLKTLLDTDLAAFNRLVREKDVPAVVAKERNGSAAATGQ